MITFIRGVEMAGRYLFYPNGSCADEDSRELVNRHRIDLE
jgi:hypothetical protein